MLDVLSNGRLDFGVGRGSADYEYGNFNVDFDTRDGRTQEALDIILGLWTQSDFSFQGEFYQVKDLTIAPRPVQQPHPPVYLAVSRTPASVDVAVSRDLPILTSFSTPEADNLRQHGALQGIALNGAFRQGSDAQVPVIGLRHRVSPGLALGAGHDDDGIRGNLGIMFKYQDDIEAGHTWSPRALLASPRNRGHRSGRRRIQWPFPRNLKK